MNSFKVGDVVETTIAGHVLVGGRITHIGKGLTGEVMFVDADTQHVEVYFNDIGRANVNKWVITAAQKPQTANDGGEAVDRPRLGDTLTPEAKNKRLLKFRDENAALQAENERLRSELEAARTAVKEAFYHIENVPQESLNHNRSAQSEVEYAYGILDDAIKAMEAGK